MSSGQALQDLAPFDPRVRYCFGCGPDNEHGLRIKSYREGDEVVCTWQPEPYHCSFRDILNGGIATLIMDCHSYWTAVVAAYEREGRELFTGEPIYMATRSMRIDYLQPTPLDSPLDLRAHVNEMDDRKAVVSCSLFAGLKECVRAEATFVRIASFLTPGKAE